MSDKKRVEQGTVVKVQAFFHVEKDTLDGDMLIFNSMSECDKLEAIDASGTPHEVEYDDEGRLFYSE